jgi:hypothetical protein
VLRFPGDDGVGATNGVVGLEVRPAELARELSAGNRTEAGAETHAVLAGVSRTYRHQDRDILRAVVGLLRHGPGRVLEFGQAPLAIPAL